MLSKSPGIYCQKGRMEQVCDGIIYFGVSFRFLYFHKRLGHALCCSSLFVINFHSSYHQGSLTSQFPKLEKAHKLHVPPTLASSRLKWLLLQLLPSSRPRPAVRADKIQTQAKKSQSQTRTKRSAQVMDKVGHPSAHPILRLNLCPKRNKHRWSLSSLGALFLQQPPKTLDARDSSLSPWLIRVIFTSF